MERLKLPPRDFLLAMFEDRDGILIHRRPVTPVLAVAVADDEALRLEHFGEFANGGVSSNF